MLAMHCIGGNQERKFRWYSGKMKGSFLSVSLEILLLSLNYSSILAEQLDELKIMRALLLLTAPRGIWNSWRRENWSDFAGQAGHLYVYVPKQQQRENGASWSTMGCEQRWDRGKHIIRWS